jgi:hypothetical protein
VAVAAPRQTLVSRPSRGPRADRLRGDPHLPGGSALRARVRCLRGRIRGLLAVLGPPLSTDSRRTAGTCWARSSVLSVCSSLSLVPAPARAACRQRRAPRGRGHTSCGTPAVFRAVRRLSPQGRLGMVVVPRIGPVRPSLDTSHRWMAKRT